MHNSSVVKLMSENKKMRILLSVLLILLVFTTYLRMNPHLFQEDNWRRFVAFVKKMKEGKNPDRCREEVEGEA